MGERASRPGGVSVRVRKRPHVGRKERRTLGRQDALNPVQSLAELGPVADGGLLVDIGEEALGEVGDYVARARQDGAERAGRRGERRLDEREEGSERLDVGGEGREQCARRGMGDEEVTGQRARS